MQDAASSTNEEVIPMISAYVVVGALLGALVGLVFVLPITVMMCWECGHEQILRRGEITTTFQCTECGTVVHAARSVSFVTLLYETISERISGDNDGS